MIKNWTKISNKISKFVSKEIIRREIVTENVRTEAKNWTERPRPGWCVPRPDLIRYLAC